MKFPSVQPQISVEELFSEDICEVTIFEFFHSKFLFIGSNARLVEAKNTTIVLMKEDFNHKTFEAALRQIVEDESFAVRAKRLASLMVNKPFPLKERLLSTVEFSTKHGKIDNLDIYGTNFNTLQYYSIDVIAFLAMLTCLAIIFIIQLCKLCFRVTLVKRIKKE
ncbi:hypothetical protein ANCCAN_00829 [Ancylostoma caninum]|uniref:glucuronosyltransferase n=1 Tax=Ancylostoma caninum TaxID=29170 RepID=A0A368H8D5_ANCCA|nr:hypothetical protein ANCCAN_00829 [Ancylostoma caninum]